MVIERTASDYEFSFISSIASQPIGKKKHKGPTKKKDGLLTRSGSQPITQVKGLSMKLNPKNFVRSRSEGSGYFNKKEKKKFLSPETICEGEELTNTGEDLISGLANDFGSSEYFNSMIGDAALSSMSFNFDTQKILDDKPTTEKREVWNVNNYFTSPATSVESRNEEDNYNSMIDTMCGYHAPIDVNYDSGRCMILDSDDSFSSFSSFGKVFGELMSLPASCEKDSDDRSVVSLSSLQELVKECNNKGTKSKSIADDGCEKCKKSIDVNEIVKQDKETLTSTSDTKENDEDNSVSENIQRRRKILCNELRRAMDEYGRYDIKCANIASALGDLFDESREHLQALQVYQEAIAIYSTKLGDHHETTLGCKVRLGMMFDKLGNHDEAIEVFYGVFCMRKALNGDKHLSACDMMKPIAKALENKGRIVQAIKELKRALKMYRDALGDSHPNVASTVDEIAHLYIKLGDHDKAAAILEEVVKLRAAVLGVNNPVVARSLVQWGMSQEKQGCWDKAVKSHKKAYAIYIDLADERSNDAIGTLERIGICYEEMYENDKAITALVGVLRIRKKTLGGKDVLVAATFAKLGRLLRKSFHLDKAMKCQKHALSIYVDEGKEAADASKIADCMHEMALVYREKAQVSEAAKILRQEVSMRQKMGKDALPQVARTLNDLALAEHHLKNNKAALTNFMDALAIYEKTESHELLVGETLHNTGLVLSSIGHKKKASESFLDAYKIFKEHHLADKHDYVIATVTEMKRLGHKCQCISGVPCNTVPCLALYNKRKS